MHGPAAAPLGTVAVVEPGTQGTTVVQLEELYGEPVSSSITKEVDEVTERIFSALSAVEQS